MDVIIVLKSTECDYALAIRNGEVVLGRRDLSDPYQQWRKDDSLGGEDYKDEDGNPSFALVNKATGEAIKATSMHQQVELTPYDPDNRDESVLWTQNGDDSFMIRSVNNTSLNLDAYRASQENIRDGVKIVCYETTRNENQLWEYIYV